jgi:general secretion pathway protein C
MMNRYFTLVNLLLVTLAVYFGVSIFYAVVASRLTGSPPPMPSGRSEPPVGAAAVSRLADYQVIVERNLFNSGKQALAGAGKTGDAGLDVDKLKQTELKVKLWGTTAGQVEAAPAAFIEDPKTREHRMYRTGDALQNAVIKMILREKVVLTVNGKDEVLVQEEPGVTKTGGPALARADSGQMAPPAAAEPIQQVTVKEDQIERAMESLSDLMSQATFRPHLEDGQPAGISITGIKPNAVFRKLRLRNGDVITGVNDQSIASVEDAVKVFGTLSTEAPIQVKIKRRGREETLEYKIE